MSNKHGPLFRTMESLGYPEADIVRVAHALGTAYDKMSARAYGRHPLTPMMAMAGWSEQQRLVFAQAQGAVKQLTAHAFHIDDISKPVDVDELNRAMRAAAHPPSGALRSNRP